MKHWTLGPVHFGSFASPWSTLQLQDVQVSDTAWQSASRVHALAPFVGEPASLADAGVGAGGVGIGAGAGVGAGGAEATGGEAAPNVAGDGSSLRGTHAARRQAALSPRAATETETARRDT